MYSYSFARASIIGFLVAAAAYFGVKAAFLLLWERSLRMADSPGGTATFVVAALAGVVLHECIHLAVAKFLTAGEPVKVSMGFRVRHMLPYTRISGPIPVRYYRMIAVAPLLILGVGPTAAGLLFGESMLSLFGAFMMAIAAGDVLVLFAVRSLSPHDRVEDHPDRVGCQLS